MNPFLILAAVQAVAGGIQAYGQVQAGKAQKAAIREQAKQEEMAAQSQELQRRQELNRALAANAVALSTAGITGEGTPASLALESARQASLSEMTIDLSERLRRASLERQARSAVQTAGISAASTLLQSGVKAGQLSQTPTDG
jgi:uncharacterized membrane protein